MHATVDVDDIARRVRHIAADQCEDRAHRIGQKDNVTAGYFLGRNTIDEKIYKIIQTKRDMAATITGSTEQIEEDIINLVVDLFS